MSNASRPCPCCHGTGVHQEHAVTPMRELRWTLSSDQHTGSHVTLVGEINELTNLDRLSALPRPVRFDLSGVPYVNTMGALYLLVRHTRLDCAVAGDYVQVACAVECGFEQSEHSRWLLLDDRVGHGLQRDVPVRRFHRRRA